MSAIKENIKAIRNVIKVVHVAKKPMSDKEYVLLNKLLNNVQHETHLLEAKKTYNQ